MKCRFPQILGMEAATAKLAPLPGETQVAFAVRFHEALRQSMPETDARDSAMISAWRQSGQGHRLFAKASERFSRDHVHRRDVPVFTEHTTKRMRKDAQGREVPEAVVYDRRALESIVDRCNHRIADTGDFAPLIEGHTPDPESGKPMPQVLGYAGPYRLGMVGNVNPRWAIFADEWHDREAVPKLQKMRRRSPEVWLEERMEDRFFDPIAVLGAETPRLDMGLARFSRGVRNGREVEKYSAAMPAASNVFVPGFGDEKKKSYSSEGANMALAPEDINAVVEAIRQTDEFQWLQQHMDDPAEQGSGMPPVAEEPPAAPPTAPVEPPAAPPAAEGSSPFEPDDEDKATMSRYMAGDCDDEEMQQYWAGKRTKYMASASTEGQNPDPPAGDVNADQYSRDPKARERYARIERENRELKAEREKYAARLEALESKSRRAERYSKLSELQSEGYQFDLEKQVEKAARMTDQQFEEHCEEIVEHYQRSPLNHTVPIFGGGRNPIDRDKGGRMTPEKQAEALKYHKAEHAKGNAVTWEQAMDHAMKPAV